MTQPIDVVAFISHATADNERFVLRFNAALAARGIMTILDAQDFRPGNSLIRHIFDDGIERANAFIGIISQNTSDRPYVRAELEHAVVRNIEDDVPLVAVVLDGATIPAPLRSKVQVRVQAGQTPEDVAKIVADALLDKSRPRVQAGQPGAIVWRAAAIHNLQAGADVEDYVKRYSVDRLLNQNVEIFAVARLLNQIEADEIGNANDLDAVLHDLERRGLIERRFEMGTRLPIGFTLTRAGTRSFLRSVDSVLYERTCDAVIAQVKASYPGGSDISDIAEAVGAPSVLVRHIGDRLAADGLARLIDEVGGEGCIIGEPSIRLQ